MFKIHNIKFLSYFLLLFPPALISGPFLPDLIISLSSIYFIIFLIVNKNTNFLISDFTKFFLSFYLFLVLRSLFSDEILFSLKNTFFYFRFWIFAYIVKYLFENHKYFKKLFISVLFFTLLVVCIDALIEYLRSTHWLFDKSDYPENDNYRISGLFDEEYILGGFILSLFPTASLIYYKVISKNKVVNILTILAILVFVFTIIISGERSSLIRLFIFLFAFIMLTTLIKKPKLKIITFLIIVSTVLIGIISQPKLNTRLIYHTFDLIFQKDDANIIDRNLTLNEYIKKIDPKNLNLTYFSKEHSDHAMIALNMFKNNILFGHGVKMFRFRCSEEKYYINPRACTTHPHGILFVFLSETGLLGFSFLLISYFYLIRNFFRSTSNLDKTILLSIFIYLFPFVPLGYFFNNYFSIILYTLIGLHLGTKKAYRVDK